MHSKQPIPLQTVTPDEFLPPISRWARLGGLTLVGVFGGVTALAALFKYNVTVKAPAVIRPTGELRVIEAATSGTVEEIAIRPNQTLQQGDAIAIVDDSQLQTQKRQLQISIDQLHAQLQQVNQQLASIQSQIDAERAKLNSAIAAAEADLRLAQRQYRDQQAVTQADTKEAESAVRFATEELKRFRQLADTGAVPELQIQEKKAALETAQARLERTQALLDPSNAQVEQSQATLKQAIADRDATLAQLAQTRQQILQQHAELQSQLLDKQQALRQTETDIEQTIIRSPTDGIVQALELRNPKQVVQSGEVVGHISPTNALLVIKASVSHADISRIEVGQNVQIRLESCPYPDYGVASGIVTAIAPDSQQQSSNPDAVALPSNRDSATYNVIVQPQQLILRTPQKTCALQAGMQGRADIITQQETPLSFFLRKMRLFADI